MPSGNAPWQINWNRDKPAIEVRVTSSGEWEVRTDLTDKALVVAMARILQGMVDNGEFQYVPESEQLELPDVVPGSEEDLIREEGD